MKTLHIYAQDFWHTPATIVGDRAAIIALIQTLQEVLSTQTGVEHKLEASVSDGEGYDVRIILIEDEETWKTLKYPYSDPDCDYREGKIIP